MKTTKKTVMKKPAVKKMSTGGTTKKMSYSGVKPKALKKAALGMSMGSSGTDDSECYETFTDAQGKPGRRRKKSCSKKWSNSSKGGSGNGSPKGRGLFTG